MSSGSDTLHLSPLGATEETSYWRTGWLGLCTPFWGGKMADPFSAEQATFVVQQKIWLPQAVADYSWADQVGATVEGARHQNSSTEVAEVVSRQFVLQGSPNGSTDSSS